VKRWIARFLARLRESASPHTLRAYTANLGTFAAFCEAEGVRHPKELTHRFLRGFVVELNGRGLAKSSVARYVAAVRAFTRHLVREQVIDRVSSSVLKRGAIQRGMRTLRMDGMEKVKLGMTTLEEVLRVVV